MMQPATNLRADIPPRSAHKRPRIGFLGVGWIGRHRMQAMLETGAVEAAIIADPSPDMCREAAVLAPDAQVADGLEAVLDAGIDGLVIATPSSLHAAQSIAALKRGIPVFCQKPLGRTAPEVAEVVSAARQADVLLAVDLSYRFTDGMQHIRRIIAQGGIGRVFAVDLTFHNAYGPDKPWFYDPVLSGGGCVMDLGVHLVDLALWTLGDAPQGPITSSLFAQGDLLGDRADIVEDYATASFMLRHGTAVRLACSWRLHAGCDAVISAAFHGTNGGLVLRNIDGSFYDFIAERHDGTSSQTLAAPPDAWGGRAAADWAARLAAGERFDPAIERIVDVAQVLDGIYGRA